MATTPISGKPIRDGRRLRALLADVLVDGSGAPATRNALVVLNDCGRIEFAGSANAPGAPDISSFDVATVVNFGASSILPGLIDSHVHLTFGVTAAETSLSVDPIRSLVDQVRRDSDAERALRAETASSSALQSGTTTVRDCGAKGRTAHALRDLSNQSAVAAPRILLCGSPVTTPGGHGWWLGGGAQSIDEVLAVSRKTIHQGSDLVKVMATGGGMTPGSNRLKSQYPVATLAALVEDSWRSGRRVGAHAHGLDGIRAAAAAGVHMIEHCSWSTSCGPRLDERVADLMLRNGTFVGETSPGWIAKYAKNGAGLADLPSPFPETFEIFRVLLQMGVRVVTSSDAMEPITPFADFPWAVVASHDYGGLSPEAAVHSATGLAARALDLDDQIGTLETGKIGDILVVAGDVSKNIRAITQPLAVLRDARVLA